MKDFYLHSLQSVHLGPALSSVCRPTFNGSAWVSPWVPPDSVQGQFSPDIFQLESEHFHVRGSLTETRWSSAPIAGESFLIEMPFPGRYIIHARLCRWNKQKITADSCSDPWAAFERITWDSLTAVKTQFGVRGIALLFRAAFWVFMGWTFWLRVDFVPAALFFCLSSTHLIRINRMNELFLFHKHNAAFTVSPVVLRIHLPFFSKHLLCGYPAAQNWAGSGPCVVVFCRALFLQELNDLHWFYYFSTWSIIHFSTLWHKPNYRETEIRCFLAQWCIIKKDLFFSVVIVNSYAMVSKCFACCAGWGRWMGITLDSKLETRRKRMHFLIRMSVFTMPVFLPSWHACCFVTCILYSKAHGLDDTIKFCLWRGRGTFFTFQNGISCNKKRQLLWCGLWIRAVAADFFFLQVHFVYLGIIRSQWRHGTLRTAALSAFSLCQCVWGSEWCSHV